MNRAQYQSVDPSALQATSSRTHVAKRCHAKAAGKNIHTVAAATRLHLLQKKIEALTGSWTRVEKNSAVGGSGRPGRTMATEAVEDEPLGGLRRVSASLEGQWGE